MALFLFTIGMEVKREVMVGELSDIHQIILPVWPDLAASYSRQWSISC